MKSFEKGETSIRIYDIAYNQGQKDAATALQATKTAPGKPQGWIWSYTTKEGKKCLQHGPTPDLTA